MNGWHTQSIADGNDLAAIERALSNARAETRRPSLILVRTHLAYGSPNKQDTFKAHGSPLGEDEVRLTKQNLGWPTELAFYIPEVARTHFREAIAEGQRDEAEWIGRFSSYARAFPELAQELEQIMRGELPVGWDEDIPIFPADAKGMATRVASGRVMNAIAPRMPALIGGSADLDPSTHTAVAWRVTLETRDRPVALILTRQDVPTLDRAQFAAADGLRRGGYVLADAPALVFWWSVLGGVARHHHGIALLSLFTTMVHTGALGALLTLSTVVWYSTYRESAPLWGLTALQDPQLGGIVMWVPAGFVYVACALFLAARWLSEPQRAFAPPP